MFIFIMPSLYSSILIIFTHSKLPIKFLENQNNAKKLLLIAFEKIKLPCL